MTLQMPPGVAKFTFFESLECLEALEQVRTWLSYYCKRYIKSDPPTKESLSQMLISFIRFHFDNDSTKARTTRLPMQCLFDFNPGGGICHFFATIYRYKAEQRLEKFDFDLTFNTSSKEYDQKIALNDEIYARLIDVMCVRMPVAYIRPEVDGELCQNITKILKDRQVEITKDETEATHMIYPIVEANEDYAWPSFKRGQHVMIHSYRRPESFDLWVANTFDLSEDIPENTSSFQDIWRIDANWVLDLEKYNEWMREKDYEVDLNGAKKTHQHKLIFDEVVKGEKKTGQQLETVRSQKRNRSPSNAPRDTKRRSKASALKLPTTECPDCKKEIAIKSLNRHLREKHGDDVFKCTMCTYETTRKSLLQDHQRRIHMEPIRLGRPNKKSHASHRKRSPFRVSNFEIRHATKIEKLESTAILEQKVNDTEKRLIALEESKKKDANETDKLNETSIEKLENAKILEQKVKETEKRLIALEELKKKEANETDKIKSRITLIESRHKEEDLPNLKDIPSLLNFLNLNSSPTKNDIRTSINMRLMEISSESSISNEIFYSKKMTCEKRLELSSFYNEASDILLKWLKDKNK